MTSYVYIQSEPGLYTVGFYGPDGKWNPDSDHSTRDEAADRVHYLNGGNPEPEFNPFLLEGGDLDKAIERLR